MRIAMLRNKNKYSVILVLVPGTVPGTPYRNKIIINVARVPFL